MAPCHMFSKTHYCQPVILFLLKPTLFIRKHLHMSKTCVLVNKLKEINITITYVYIITLCSNMASSKQKFSPMSCIIIHEHHRTLWKIIHAYIIIAGYISQISTNECHFQQCIINDKSSPTADDISRQQNICCIISDNLRSYIADLSSKGTYVFRAFLKHQVNKLISYLRTRHIYGKFTLYFI